MKTVFSLYKFAALLRGGADKSLVRPSSRSRRTESIVSLERGVCSCAELQVFYFKHVNSASPLSNFGIFSVRSK